MIADMKTQMIADNETQIDTDICANQRLKSLRKSAFKKAQASLEVTLAFVCIMILLFASIKVFIWMNERMIRRQQDYEKTRVAAGSIGAGQKGVYVDESSYPKLDILGERR